MLLVWLVTRYWESLSLLTEGTWSLALLAQGAPVPETSEKAGRGQGEKGVPGEGAPGRVNNVLNKTEAVRAFENFPMCFRDIINILF